MVEKINLQGKTAIITGGAGVLCSTIAEELASSGINTIIIDISEDKLKKTAEDIESDNLETYRASVLDKERLLEVKEEVLEQHGSIDILINGAGGNKPRATTGEEQEFFDIDQEDIGDVFDLNFQGTVLPCQVFGEALKEQKEGIIINVSSMAAFKPLTKTIAYSAAKSAVSNFTQWLAVHMNQNYSENIRVNAIAPGFLLTEQNRYLLIDEETGEETERGQKIKDNTPMNRYGRPDELVGAVKWLCSDLSSFVNGIVLPIDGGFSAYSGV